MTNPTPNSETQEATLAIFTVESLPIEWKGIAVDHELMISLFYHKWQIGSELLLVKGIIFTSVTK